MNAKAWKTWSFDKSRIHDGYVFATPGERCRYIGMWLRDQPRWLREHPDRWRRIEDVQQEAAPPGPPVDSEIDLGAGPAGPNGQTPSRDVRKDCHDENDVALVDTLAGDCSPPCQQISLPTPETATLTKRSTKAELLPPAKPAMSEAEGPKTETTPLGAMRRKLGRSGGRQLKKQKLPPEISKRRKRSPALLRVVLDSLAGYPVKKNAASKAGIHPKSIEYWLKGSAAGRDGYDIEWRGETAKFHEHHESAMEEGYCKLEDAAVDRALGYDEILTYQGRVLYKIDDSLWKLGCRGPDAYLKDENGKPVPETVRKQDPKMMRWLLARHRPGVWGKHQKNDVTQKGGVLILGAPLNSEELEKKFGGEQQIQDVEFAVEDDSEGEK
jgi:hypothetical protein